METQKVATVIRLLVGIPVISRDANVLRKCLSSLLCQKNNDEKHLFKDVDILLVTRENDYDIIKSNISCIEIPNDIKVTFLIHKVVDYVISERRHNIEYVKKKRRHILNYAEKNGYDALLFVDADIIMDEQTIREMLKCTSPVTMVAYVPVWGTGRIVCSTEGKLFDLDEYVLRKKIKTGCVSVGGGGLGCTMISKSAFHVPIKIGKHKVHDDLSIVGEDIGFFQNCGEMKIKVCCLVKDHVIHDPVKEG